MVRIFWSPLWPRSGRGTGGELERRLAPCWEALQYQGDGGPDQAVEMERRDGCEIRFESRMGRNDWVTGSRFGKEGVGAGEEGGVAGATVSEASSAADGSGGCRGPQRTSSGCDLGVDPGCRASEPGSPAPPPVLGAATVSAAPVVVPIRRNCSCSQPLKPHHDTEIIPLQPRDNPGSRNPLLQMRKPGLT